MVRNSLSIIIETFDIPASYTAKFPKKNEKNQFTRSSHSSENWIIKEFDAITEIKWKLEKKYKSDDQFLLEPAIRLLWNNTKCERWRVCSDLFRVTSFTFYIIFFAICTNVCIYIHKTSKDTIDHFFTALMNHKILMKNYKSMVDVL